MMRSILLYGILVSIIVIVNADVDGLKKSPLEPKKILEKIQSVRNSLKKTKSTKLDLSSISNSDQVYNDVLIGILKGFLDFVKVDTSKYNNNIDDLSQAALNWLNDFFIKLPNLSKNPVKQFDWDNSSSNDSIDSSLSDNMQAIIQSLISSFDNSTDLMALLNDLSVFDDLSKLFNQLVIEIVKYFLNSLGITLNIDDNNYKDKYINLVSQLQQLVLDNNINDTNPEPPFFQISKKPKAEIGNKLAMLTLKLLSQSVKKQSLESSLKASLDQLGKQAEQLVNKIPSQEILSNTVNLIKNVDDLKNIKPQSGGALLNQLLQSKPKSN